MAQQEEKTTSLSGLTEQEAKEFNQLFVTAFLLFTAVAIVAHVLVWMWKPWLQGGEGMSLLHAGQTLAQNLLG
ncbi:MAG: light-harvesting antenna LH1, beta subunit [Sandaracinaceae bacterium]